VNFSFFNLNFGVDQCCFAKVVTKNYDAVLVSIKYGQQYALG
jgi:hypothetical protein